MRNATRRAYRNPLFWVVAALTVIALALGLGLAFDSTDLNDVIQQQQADQAYNATLNDLLFNLTNAETGQRGYLITQNKAYLVPYNNALPAVEADLKTLQGSPLSNQYKRQVDRITTITDGKIAELRLTIATLQNQGQNAAFGIVDTNSGNTDMVTLRQLLGNISSVQQTQLHNSALDAKQRTRLLEYAAPLVTFVDICLILTILYLTRRAIEKEQRLDSLQEQFVAVASHQLRTPATIVKQYLYLLLDGKFGELNREQRNILKTINDSNERGIKVANGLLNTARIDNQEINIHDDPVDLSELLTEVAGHYRKALANKKDQTLVVRMPKRPIMAKVDPFYIGLIFENLIENASKYSNRGKKIYVSLKAKHDLVTFSVKDHGHGIDASDLSLLFKKFSRLNAAIKKVEGSGLGLYLVKQAAVLHGGDARVDSIVGRGSTFTVTIKQGI